MIARPSLRFHVLAVLVLAAAQTVLASPPATGQTAPSQKLWAAYWTVQPGFRSTLEMKNNLVQGSLNVSVSLYFASGEEYPLGPIALGARQTAVLDINGIMALLPAAVQARAGTEGTIEVDFTAPTPSALMGSVSVVNPAHGTAWNFFLYTQRPDVTPLPLRGAVLVRQRPVRWFYCPAKHIRWGHHGVSAF
jgi:hypothetical protein